MCRGGWHRQRAWRMWLVATSLNIAGGADTVWHEEQVQQLRAAAVVTKANGARRDAAHRAVILFASHAQRSEQRAWRCWMRFAHAHDLRKVTH